MQVHYNTVWYTGTSKVLSGGLIYTDTRLTHVTHLKSRGEFYMMSPFKEAQLYTTLCFLSLKKKKDNVYLNRNTFVKLVIMCFLLRLC